LATMDINLQKHIQEHLPEYVEDLKTLCRQPSVTAQYYGVTDYAQMELSFVDVVSKTEKGVYGKKPLMTSGLARSGPMYYISGGLGLPIASSGVAFPDDKIHAAAIIEEFSKDE